MKFIITFFALLGAFFVHAQTPSEPSLAVDTAYETMPVYPGGEQAMLEYLTSIPYPSVARENDIEGQVKIRFIVDKDGSVRKVEVAESSNSTVLDNAAVAHVQQMPKWKPGTQFGKPVRVQYIVPIGFKLVSRADRKKKGKG